MNNEDLDKFFRDRINKSSSALDQKADWDVFSQILSKSEGFQEISFDSSIKSKVADFNIPYNNKHWEFLKQRLIKEENLRRKIFISSIIESAAIVVLLFIFQQYDHSKNIEYKYSDSKELASNENKIKSGIKNTDLTELYSHKAFEYEQKNESQINQTEEKLIDIESQILFEEVVTPLTTKKEVKLYSVNELEQDLNSLMSNNLNLIVPTTTVPETKNDPIIKEECKTIGTAANVKPNETVLEVQSVKNRSILNIPALTEERFDIAKVILPASIKYKETDAMHFLIPVIGFGQGIIKSSYDKIYNLKAYTIYSSQITTGLFYAYKKSGVELLSGLRYTKKAYNPQRISEVYYDKSNAPYRVSLEKIKYDIIEVPLQFKTYFKQSPVINFYAKVGSSLNLTLASRYDVNEKDLSFNSFAAKNIATTSDGEIISNNAKLSKKEFNTGLFQHGGTLKENAFLTVTGELGLERRINMSNHIIIGMEYAKYFMIEGIGPNSDKFNALNFNIGLKHKIK